MFTSVEPVWRDFVQVQNATQAERVDIEIFTIKKTRKRVRKKRFFSEKRVDSKNSEQASKRIQVTSYEY